MAHFTYVANKYNVFFLQMALQFWKCSAISYLEIRESANLKD